MQFIKRNIFLILILLLALSLRLFLLNLVPPALTNDELDYDLNAKSIYVTGKPVPNTSLGVFSLGENKQGKAVGELPAIITSVAIGPFSLSQLNSRFTYSIFSSFTTIILYLFVIELSKNKKLALISAFVLAVNPWSIHTGRLGHEVSLVVFFYLTGLYLLIKNTGWKILLSLIFFTLAFFTYHGAKLLLLPLIMVTSIWKVFYDGKSNLKPIIVLFSLSLIISLSYLYSLRFQAAGGRVSELILFDERNKFDVDLERRLTLPNTLRDIFSNKFSIIANKFISNYFNGFNVSTLFLTGENTPAYAFRNHGYFYYIELLFLVLGLIGCLKVFKSKKAVSIILLIVFVSLFSSSVSKLGQEYASRASLLFPMLIIFISAGIFYLSSLSKKYKLLSSLLIAVFYLFSITNFLYFYFFRLPLIGSGAYFFEHKVLVRYLALVHQKSPQSKIIVSVKDPEILFEKYIFYNTLYNTKADVIFANSRIANRDFHIANIYFSNKCLNYNEYAGKNIIYIDGVDRECSKPAGKYYRIVSAVDAGNLYTFNKDILCMDSNINSYVSLNSLSDFDVYKLKKKDFCDKWIKYY